mmetsp:Transcript_13960/g.42585  ORF Transcript_13960/g.42585 Transcript_13960/m.42585 type:complete len:318 (+) Transcript_13960:1112-2065(+)
MQGHVAQLLPTRLGGLLLRDRVSGLQLAQLHCQLELVLRIGGDGKSLLLEALCLEESRDAIVLRLRDGLDEIGRSLKVAANDCCLILEHRQQKLIRNNGEVAVEEINAVVLGQVSHDVEGPIEVLQCDYFTADRVVKPAGLGRVYEALCDPHARTNLIVDLVNKVEGVVDTLLSHRRSRLEGSLYGVAIVPQQEERVVGDERHHVACIAPAYFPRLDVDAANKATVGPVVEEGHLSRADSKQRPAVNGIRLEGRLERTNFLEVLEQLDQHWRLANRVVARLGCPDKVERRTECLLAPSKRGVDDVFAVTTYDGEAAV